MNKIDKPQTVYFSFLSLIVKEKHVLKKINYN